MKRLYYTLTALVAVAATSCSLLKQNNATQPTYVYMEQMQVQPSQYVADFDEIDAMVRNSYTHIEAKGLDMDSLYTIFHTRVAKATTPTVYGSIVCEYMAALDNCHSFVLFKNYAIDFNVEMVEDKVFVKRIGVDTLDTLGIACKDELVAIDGTPIASWIEENKKYIPASTPRSREHYTAWSVKRSYTPIQRTYTFKTSTGIKDVTLTFCEENSRFTGAREPIEQRIIADSIGYIAINTLGDKEVVNLFTEALAQVAKLPYLIIDVRNNGGGSSWYGEQIAAYLIREPQEASVSGVQLKPSPRCYQGKLYILTDVECGSAAESFVLDLKESGDATLIGMPTAGDTGNNPRVQTTSYGTSFNIPTRKFAQVSPQGFPMEGIGIEPHLRVEQMISDYLDDVDTQLEFAIKEIL